MTTLSALVQPVRGASIADIERRGGARQLCRMEATSHALDGSEALSWGAVVRDISAGGLGLALCFPFRPGTFLAVDLQTPSGTARTVLARVVHVRERADGTWHLGCAFAKPLTEAEVKALS